MDKPTTADRTPHSAPDSPSASYVAAQELSRALACAAPQSKQDYEQVLSDELAKVLDKMRSIDLQRQSQNKFLAMVVHDAQSPLMAIIGYANLLGNRLTRLPNTLKYAEIISKCALVLQRLITDLVDLAAIESGKMRVNPRAMDLSQVLDDVRMRVRVLAQQRGIKISFKKPAALPRLHGDAARLGQVIQNLCTNAIQYTRKGGRVTVEVARRADDVLVEVRDTGIGIPKEDLPRVFERSYQGSMAQKVRRAGFGLGLEICRDIIARHGGAIDVESAVGKGSRFFFTLPLKKRARRP